MQTLSNTELQQLEGGVSGAALCGVAIGLSLFGGPIATVAAVGFCFLANPTPAY